MYICIYKMYMYIYIYTNDSTCIRVHKYAYQMCDLVVGLYLVINSLISYLTPAISVCIT